MKDWASVASSDAYQALPSDKQAEARNQYFDQVVAPQVPEAGRSQARTQFEQYDQSIRPKPPSEEGLPFADRAALARADNEHEQRLYLEKRYGKGSVGHSPDGKMYVTVNGKKYDPQGGGFWSGVGADIVGAAAPTGGAAGGAAMGAEFGSALGPAGAVVGGLAGAGLGAAFGKGVDEVGKGAQGLRDKTPEQEAGTLSHEAEMGVAGEGGGRVLGKVASRLTRGPLPKFISGTGQKTGEMTESVLDKGARPPATSTMPGAKHIQFVEALANKIVGPAKAQQDANAAFAKNEVQNILSSAGVPASHVGAVMDDINAESALSTRTAGEHVKSHLEAYQHSLEQSAEKEMADAHKLLDQKMQHLDTLTGRYRTGELGVDAAQGIRMARADFSKQASAMYKKVDRLVGDEALVPSSQVKREAQSIFESLPKTEATAAQPGATSRVAKETPAGGKIFRQETAPGTPGSPGTPIVGDPRLLKVLSDLQKMPEKVSFREAQELRSSLGQLAEMDDLTPGVSKKRLADLQDSMDRAFAAAGVDPKAKAARNLLASADSFYRDGIRKFNDVTVNKIVNDMKAGLPPNPETVAKLIVQSGNTSRVLAIKKMLGDKVWGQVIGADFGRMIDAATPTGSATVDGMRLLGEIDKRGKTFDVVYGPKLGQDLREFAQAAAVRDQKIAPEALNPSKLKDTLMQYKAGQEKLDEFMKKNYLSELTKPTRSPDDVLHFIVQPGDESRLMQAEKFFGKNSPQMTAIREAALKDMVKRAVVKTAGSDQATKILSSRIIDKEMGAYTARQQEILFPNGLANDIKTVAREMDFVFGKGEASGKSAAGIVGGGILALPFFARVPIQVVTGLWQTLFAQPGVIRALSVGLKGDTQMRAAANTAMMNIVRYSFLEGAGRDQGGEQGSQDQPGPPPGGEETAGAGAPPGAAAEGAPPGDQHGDQAGGAQAAL